MVPHIPLTPALHQLLQHLVVAVDQVTTAVGALRRDHDDNATLVHIALNEVRTGVTDSADILECVHERVDSAQREIEVVRAGLDSVQHDIADQLDALVPQLAKVDHRLASIGQSVESIEADVNLIEMTTDDARGETHQSLCLAQDTVPRFSSLEQRLAALEAAASARQLTADARLNELQASVSELTAGMDLARISLITLSDSLADLRVLQTDSRSTAATPGSFVTSLPPSPPSIPLSHSPSPSNIRRAPRNPPYVIPPRRSPAAISAASISLPDADGWHGTGASTGSGY